MEKGNYLAFTLKSNYGVFREIITDISITYPHLNTQIDIKDIHHTKALWDTGATGSVITPSTIKALNLKPIGITKVNHAGGVDDANVYLVDILLPNRIRVQNVKVTECSEKAGNFGVIIGMDIIALGDFAFTNVGRKSMVSFRIPATSYIDYVQEDEERKIKYLKKVGRNAKCPCNSGKKVKDCCGKDIF